MKKLIYFIGILAVLFMSCSSKNDTADKMKWWREARFGMFIHWGIYSVPAGVYHGKDIPGIGEWIMNNAKIPVSEYEKYASQFNPKDFNAEEWVKLAKEAGMKYIVITSKHHDGFAMFGSKVSRYNVVEATPFKRDVIDEMAKACKKYDIAFGLYYSQAQDWHVPGGVAIGGHWDKAQDGDMDKYLDSIAVPQVHEILNNYDGIKILWWDTPEGMTPERAAKFKPEMLKHPNLIFNNRLGGGIEGDLETPEQFIPATGIPGKNWESCMTMNDTWGYKVNDHNWKSFKTLIRNLIDIASKGGNYLLNVGPTSMGLIPDASIKRLKEIGTWMKVNSEAIYGTSASPFKKLDWGRCTRKTDGGKEILYLHIFDFPANGSLIVPGLAGEIYKAYPLSDKNQQLKVTTTDNNPAIDISGVAKDSIATVIVLETTKDIKVYNAPEIKADYYIFTDTAKFELVSDITDAEIRYTIDGSIPANTSPVSKGINRIALKNSFILKASCFKEGKPFSGVAEQKFNFEQPVAAKKVKNTQAGLLYSYFEGEWSKLPDFKKVKPLGKGVSNQPELTMKKLDNNYGLKFTGYLNIPETGVYQFQLTSDDGSRFDIAEKSLLNDGLHAMEAKTLDVALEKGLHLVEIQFFQAGGGEGLTLKWRSGDQPIMSIPAEYWLH
jgi:alpha-L-fucosidase